MQFLNKRGQVGDQDDPGRSWTVYLIFAFILLLVLFFILRSGAKILGWG